MAISWRDDPAKSPTSRNRANARALRRAQTEPERKLWWHLRHRLPIDGSHFRRQVPIGPYVADFCCLKARLIIEVDGNQHGYDESVRHDAHRDAYLARESFRVLRFSNFDVMSRIDEVLDTVYAALYADEPHPLPPPRKGEGKEPRP